MTYAHPIPNDLDSFWMPFTPNRQFKKEPRIVVSAKDMHYTSADGRPILDGSAGLWCVNAGHGRQRIVDAITQSANTLDFAPSFQYANPAAFELASRISSLTPDPLNRIFFTNSGSEAVDTALKIAIAYHRARGDGTRTRLIGRERGYHGVGFGGISVGGIVANRKFFGSLLTGVDHLPHTHLPKLNSFSKGQPEHGAELADDLERIVQLHDPSTVAAVIVEPMAGSTGVLVPPRGYLQRLRSICDKYGILLIFDEVIAFRQAHGGSQAVLGIRPDISSLGKIIGGGLPVGAIAGRREVMQVFEVDGKKARLPHGGTFNANPMTMVAGRAAMAAWTEDAVEDLNRMGAYCRDKLQEAIRIANVPGQVTGSGSLFRFHTHGRPMNNYRDTHPQDQEAERNEQLFRHLIGAGLYSTPYGLGCVSTATSTEDVDRLAEATTNGLRAMRDTGLFDT